MIKTKAGPIAADRVSHFAGRINNLLDEKQMLGDDMREVYDEAKKEGVNTAALRKVIAKRRAKTPDPAMEAYDHALDQAALMVSNGSTSLRGAATESGFSKSAIQRQVSHRKRNASSGTEPPHDPVTGEVGAGTLEARQEGDGRGASRPAERDVIPPPFPEGKSPCTVCSTEPEAMKCDGVLSGRVSGSDEQEAAAAYRAGVEAASTPSASAALTLYQRITGSFLPPPSDDPGPMPLFLRRARA